MVVGAEGGNTPPVPGISRSGDRPRIIFGSGTPGAEDTPSRLLNPCEFPIAGGTCSMPKDT